MKTWSWQEAARAISTAAATLCSQPAQSIRHKGIPTLRFPGALNVAAAVVEAVAEADVVAVGDIEEDMGRVRHYWSLAMSGGGDTDWRGRYGWS